MSNKEPNPDSPLTDDEWTQLGPPMRGREALEKIFGADNTEALINKRPGRPITEDPKQKVTIRLDRDILEALRATGSGWQTRLNQHLREWVKP